MVRYTVMAALKRTNLMVEEEALDLADELAEVIYDRLVAEGQTWVENITRSTVLRRAVEIGLGQLEAEYMDEGEDD